MRDQAIASFAIKRSADSAALLVFFVVFVVQ